MSKFQIGDRVVVKYNPPGNYTKMPLGDTGTVRTVRGAWSTSYIRVDFDQPCEWSASDQLSEWIETRFDFAEDHELTEVSSDVGTLLFG